MTPPEVRAWTWPEHTGVVPPAPGTPVEETHGGHQLLGSLRPLVGPLDPTVADIGMRGVGDLATTLPQGAARAEAVVGRWRLDGHRLVWGSGPTVASLGELEELNRERGRSSVQMLRHDPELVSVLQVGGWYNAGWRVRAARRVLLGDASALAAAGRRAGSGGRWRLVADLAFWAGVRAEATDLEWRRLTSSSFVVLAYHRLAGERRPGQEQLDCSPRRFAAQLRLLHRLGYRPLTVEDLERFRRDPNAVLPRRRYMATFDDAYLDNERPLLAHLDCRPLLFAPSALVGATASFSSGDPLLDWSQLEGLVHAGVVVGSHTRSHPKLPTLDRDGQSEELAGSRQELAARLGAGVDTVAYPHGAHDRVTIDMAAGAGYTVGFTTEPGRNGFGTHPLCLRRVGVWRGDGSPLVLWKALTGEYVPGQARTEGRGWVTRVLRERRPGRGGAARTDG